MHNVKVSLINLGCARNLVDSETLLFHIKQSGFEITLNMEEAHVGIINTCAFINDAKQEAIDVVLQAVHLKEIGSLKHLIVAGCLVQRYPKELRCEIKEIDALVSIACYSQIGKIIKQVLRGKCVHKIESPESLTRFFGKRYPLTPHSYTYLKISEGCNNYCSYCTIPYIKGSYRERDPKSLLDELESVYSLVPELKEINIVAQDTTCYGYKKKYSLINLLRSVSNYDFVKWIRLLYTNPEHFNDDLIKEIADNPKICRYIDLPIQHISDKILRLMNRGVESKHIIELIDKIRELVPEVTIRTSLIVGFPEETLDDFKELVGFVKKIKFEKLGVFIYSREEGTKAYSYKGHISQEEKLNRFNHIMQIQQEISEENLGKFIGQELNVLIDEASCNKNEYITRTEFDAPEVDGQVFLRTGTNCKIGDFKKARIIDTLEYDLIADEIT